MLNSIGVNKELFNQLIDLFKILNSKQQIHQFDEIIIQFSQEYSILRFNLYFSKQIPDQPKDKKQQITEIETQDLMRHNVIYEKPQAAYKIPNPNFPQQLCAFLSQSKHQKQEQYEGINEYMVEQFIHLFQICNINRFIDYTNEFINEIRNVILRLQVVQKRPYQSLDQKDEFMYLIVSGKVQKIKRQKPNLNKRVSRLNMTGFNLQSNSLMSHFNPRSSHQTLHNIQLKEMQKSLIQDRHSRMSITNGNLWNQLVSSSKKKNKLQDKNFRGFSAFSNGQKISGLFVNQAQIHQFQQRINLQKEAFNIGKLCQKGKQNRNQGRLLLQPLQEQVYQCLTPVKYIKLLKWSYDQLVQYVFKYQNDNLIEFLSKTLLISQHDIKFHQLHNKTVIHFYPKKESQHSNMYIGLQKGALYILRKGSVQMKYQSKASIIKNQNNFKILSSNKSNPNLAQYVNKPQTFYKKVVLNQGAIICPELEGRTFYIQSLQDVVLIEFNHCLFQILKSQLKDNWWNKKLLKSYQKLKAGRSSYMKDQQVIQKQEIRQLKMNNVSIQSKSGKFHCGNKQKSRFRVQPKIMNEKSSPKAVKENSGQTCEEKQNIEEDFNSQEYKQFISFLPYEIMIRSKQKISMKLNEKSKNKHISNKVFNYLKKSQKGNSSSKYQNKLFELKMKNIASKQIGPKQLKNLYDEINNNDSKKQFHKSLNGNWFKQDTQISSDPNFDEKTAKNTSVVSNGQNKILSMDKKGIETYSSAINIGKKNNKYDQSKKVFSNDSSQSNRKVQKKVTFRKDQNEDSSDQEYLCSDDTGLINKFVQNSHNYQKQLIFLINSSQREEKSQMRKKKKLKTCKTEQSNGIFSHNLINDIMKRVNNTNTNKKFTIISNKNSQKESKTQSACDKAQQSQSSQLVNQNNFKNKQEIKEGTNQNSFSTLIEGMIDKKASSFTNQSSLRSSSCRTLKYKNVQSSDQRRTSIDKKNTYIQSSFFKEKAVRPCTAQIPSRQQYRSLFFNQWIETEPLNKSQSNNNRHSDLGVANYEFSKNNVTSGDKKIWKKLKSGKIVKKSVNYFHKKNASIVIESQPFKKQVDVK